MRVKNSLKFFASEAVTFILVLVLAFEGLAATNLNAKDEWVAFASGGISGTVQVIGVPSLQTIKLIPVGVDTHEPVFSGSNKPGTNGSPDGRYV